VDPSASENADAALAPPLRLRLLSRTVPMTGRVTPPYSGPVDSSTAGQGDIQPPPDNNEVLPGVQPSSTTTWKICNLDSADRVVEYVRAEDTGTSPMRNRFTVPKTSCFKVGTGCDAGGIAGYYQFTVFLNCADQYDPSDVHATINVNTCEPAQVELGTASPGTDMYIKNCYKTNRFVQAGECKALDDSKWEPVDINQLKDC